METNEKNKYLLITAALAVVAFFAGTMVTIKLVKSKEYKTKSLSLMPTTSPNNNNASSTTIDPSEVPEPTNPQTTSQFVPILTPQNTPQSQQTPTPPTQPRPSQPRPPQLCKPPTLSTQYHKVFEGSYKIHSNKQQLIQVYLKGDNSCRSETPAVVIVYDQQGGCYKEVKRFQISANMFEDGQVKYFSKSITSTQSGVLLPFLSGACGSGFNYRYQLLTYTPQRGYFLIKLPEITSTDQFVFNPDNAAEVITLKARILIDEGHYSPHYYEVFYYKLEHTNNEYYYVPEFLGVTKQKYSVESNGMNDIIQNLQEVLQRGNVHSGISQYVSLFKLDIYSPTPRGQTAHNVVVFKMPKNAYIVSPGSENNNYYYKITDLNRSWEIKLLKTSENPNSEYALYKISKNEVKQIGSVKLGFDPVDEPLYRVSIPGKGIFYTNTYKDNEQCYLWTYQEQPPCTSISIMADTLTYIKIQVECKNTTSNNQLDNCLKSADNLINGLQLYLAVP